MNPLKMEDSLTLKESNIVPVYKSKNPSEKANYRPVSILPLLSKVSERKKSVIESCKILSKSNTMWSHKGT